MFHKQVVIGAALAIGVAVAPPITLANVTFRVNGGAPVTMPYDGGLYTGNGTSLLTTPSGGAFRINHLDSNPDPLLTASANWTDGPGAGVEIAGSIFTPTGGLIDGATYAVFGSMGITITNGANPPSSIGLGTLPFIMETFLCDATQTTCVNGGIDLVDTTIVNTVSGIGQTHTFNFDFTTTLVASSASDEVMGIALDFFSSGQQSAYGISASYVITPVPIPEPMGIAMLGSGFFAMMAVCRRRKLVA